MNTQPTSSIHATSPAANESQLKRRRFLGAAAATALAAVLPRQVLAGAKHVPPGEKIRLAYVGCGTQGFRQLMQALTNQELRITAVCDPNRGSDDYPDYGNDELNNSIRKFLKDPDWAKGARGALCGREPGQQIVNRYYAAQKQSDKNEDCRAYADFRELLVKEKDLDAVYIMTPDHLHGVIAIAAMRQGKHV
ncbi:MAG: Gfo/Idh/MocA family oxidoreductase, partial [Planctomycetota bacterium]